MATNAVRLRVFLHRNSILAWLFAAACMVLFLLTIFEWSFLETTITELNPTEYAQSSSKELYPDKCAIRNYDTLKRMSVVYTWVNGSQPCYREIRQKHGGENSVGGSRDREIDELKFSLRSMQKFMPWHEGNIYVVTPGHIPNWIDLNNPRIKVINQDDLFPDYAKEFLPTFNTHVLEQFLYLIPGLSDIYMQINDDYIFTDEVGPHEFFTCDGGIRLLQESGQISHTPPTDKKGIWISSVLNTQQEMDLRWGQEDRFFIKHAPFIYSRRAFERIHQIFDRPLYMTLKSRFRSKPDMNIPLLHHYYMQAQGSKELGIPIISPPQSEMTGFQLILMENDNVEEVKNVFDSVIARTHDSKILALNDEYSDMKVAENARDFFHKFLPEPSDFEIKPGATNAAHPLSFYKEATCEIDKTILAPFPKRVMHSPSYKLIAHHDVRSVQFMTAILKGMGIGIGLLFVYVLWIWLMNSSFVHGNKKSSIYDRV